VSTWAVPGDCHLWVNESFAADLIIASSDRNEASALVAGVAGVSVSIASASRALFRRVANLHIIQVKR